MRKPERESYMEFSIQQAVAFGYFEQYVASLQRGANPGEQNEHGQTVLHVIAAMENKGFISRLFTSEKTAYEYLMELMPYLIGMNSEHFYTLQDNHGDTALHIAVRHERWDVAQIIGRRLFANPLHDNYRKNHCGLNEFELALELYGRNGRREIMGEVFPNEYR